MAKLEIILHEKDGDVTYKQNHITGQKFLDFWELQEKIEKGNLTNVEIITLRVEFIAGLFPNDKLTAEQVLRGLDPWELNNTIQRLDSVILGNEESDEKKEP
ncbi:phage tail assembly chaperone G [Lactococcus cremoris]|jgi:hypothetical protein|uniref:Phage protein n=1 Tax=Lactococcus lactis subsp. cremoris TaxID=1359 RepID=A0AAX4AKT5_LACLC|nr:hypothetical protein [Lactococcus cremoris]WMX71748.1 hypothetical protein RF668_05705 [Lactococcus cremoris]